jgi:hypothetical protein
MSWVCENIKADSPIIIIPHIIIAETNAFKLTLENSLLFILDIMNKTGKIINGRSCSISFQTIKLLMEPRTPINWIKKNNSAKKKGVR